MFNIIYNVVESFWILEPIIRKQDRIVKQNPKSLFPCFRKARSYFSLVAKTCTQVKNLDKTKREIEKEKILQIIEMN